MSIEADILTRLRKVEKAVEALLDGHPDVRSRLRPQDALAACDNKQIQGPGPLFTPGLPPVGRRSS